MTFQPAAPLTGRPFDRVDGPLKVTGRAPYAAEHRLDRLAQAVVVTSTVAHGRVRGVDTAAAEAVPGVVAVITARNAPHLDRDSPRVSPYGELDEFAGVTFMGRPNYVLQDEPVEHYGQPIGVVVAETLEAAREAAALVRVDCEAGPAVLGLDGNEGLAYAPDALMVPLAVDHVRGDPDAALADPDAVTLDATYATPAEAHMPLEPHATTALWEGDRLTLWDATQNVHGVQKSVANTFQVPLENVRVLAPYVGGGFGGKVPVWAHVHLAALAAKVTGRPVKLALTRQQMFSIAGHRPAQRQRIRLAAARGGRLTAISQEILCATSRLRSFVEHTGEATESVYDCPNTRTSHRGVKTNIPDPCIMRAPGAAPGMFALESAVDELAHELGMDPIEFRMMNDPAERDPSSGLPWSTKALAECYRRGAEAFGWSRRPAAPGAWREGAHLVGYGCATAVYPALRLPSSARVRMAADGRVTVQTAGTDIGTGTYTVLTQIAADALGVAPGRVRVELADTDLPWTPGSGGSWGAASYGMSVLEASEALKRDVLALASADPASPLRGLNERVEAEDGRLFAASDPARGEDYAAILARAGRPEVAAEATSAPGDAMKRVSMHGWGAQFAEVRVSLETGEIRVPRFLGVYGVGRLLNPKTARSQMLGGIVWGLGEALLEDAVLDRRHGHFVNGDLAEYHVPVNADVRDVEVVFLDEDETDLSRLGVKGIGEIGIVGVAAAVANAVFNATGVRVRELPIGMDKLVDNLPEA